MNRAGDEVIAVAGGLRRRYNMRHRNKTRVKMDIEELRETFDYFDADGNGTIEKAEFAKLLEALGAEMEPDEIDIGFDMIDSDNNQHIDFDEFISWWEDR